MNQGNVHTLETPDQKKWFYEKLCSRGRVTLLIVEDNAGLAEFIAQKNKRTQKQNNALHKWCRESAKVCDEAGLD